MDLCILPDELVMEILTRSSMETIVSSIVICKDMNNFTYDSIFMIKQIIFQGILFKTSRGTNIFPLLFLWMSTLNSLLHFYDILSKSKLLQNKASYVVKSLIITRFLRKTWY